MDNTTNYIIGANAFPTDSWPHVWSIWQYILLGVVSIGGLELVMNRIIPFLCIHLFGIKDNVPQSGKHLDELDLLSRKNILFSKTFIVIFMYHTIQFAMFTPDILW